MSVNQPKIVTPNGLANVISIFHILSQGAGSGSAVGRLMTPSTNIPCNSEVSSPLKTFTEGNLSPHANYNLRKWYSGADHSLLQKQGEF
jgi:hypothetical protein